jgi:hypothetical protein
MFRVMADPGLFVHMWDIRLKNVSKFFFVRLLLQDFLGLDADRL